MSLNNPPTIAEVYSAREVIQKFLRPTPLYGYHGLSEMLGCTVYVKHENHQPVGAFKVRGGINLISRLSPEEKSRGVISASTGNHGQSIAYASRRFGVQATVVVPEGNNPDKVKGMQELGAEVVFRGKDFDDAREHAEYLSREQGFRYVHSANEPYLIAGVGTIGLEILEELPDVDVIIVPVGGGSGAAGLCIGAKSLNKDLEVIGVQSEAAPAAYLSWMEGKPVACDRMETFAEGLATRVGFELTVSILKEGLSDFVLVSDDEIRSAVKILLQTTHNLAEGAGAASLAGAFKIRDRLRGRRVALILSGGNMTLGGLSEILFRQ